MPLADGEMPSGAGPSLGLHKPRQAAAQSVSVGLRMAILRACLVPAKRITDAFRTIASNKARRACTLPSKWYAISRGWYPSITVVKSRHAVGGAQHERSRAPQTAAREWRVCESEKLVPFGGLSTPPEV